VLADLLGLVLATCGSSTPSIHRLHLQPSIWNPPGLSLNSHILIIIRYQSPVPLSLSSSPHPLPRSRPSSFVAPTRARPLVPEPTTRTNRRRSLPDLHDAHVRWNKVCAAQAGASVRLLYAGMPLCSRHWAMMRQYKLTYLRQR
jgi:hypothetical protein